MNEQRAIALWVWEQLHGLPYIWGGDDPGEGFDCSGYVIEGLKAAGVLPREGDWTAAQLANLYGMLREENAAPGCLVFWGTPRATHVEVVWRVIFAGLSQSVFTLGASGGGSATTSPEAASRDNAYIKVRPLRGGWTHFCDPFADAHPTDLRPA